MIPANIAQPHPNTGGCINVAPRPCARPLTYASSPKRVAVYWFWGKVAVGPQSHVCRCPAAKFLSACLNRAGRTCWSRPRLSTPTTRQGGLCQWPRNARQQRSRTEREHYPVLEVPCVCVCVCVGSSSNWKHAQSPKPQRSCMYVCEIVCIPFARTIVSRWSTSTRTQKMTIVMLTRNAFLIISLSHSQLARTTVPKTNGGRTQGATLKGVP